MAEGICKSFGGHTALDHVDLAVETGSVLALLGPNGAGKTTMVRILATLMRPDAGTATIAGHDLRTDPFGVKQSISLTGQFAAVDEKLTGRENLEMMAQLLRLSRMRGPGPGDGDCWPSSISPTRATGGPPSTPAACGGAWTWPSA